MVVVGGGGGLGPVYLVGAVGAGMDLEAGTPCLPGCALRSRSFAAFAACWALGWSLERSSSSIHCSLLTPYLRSSRISGCWNLQLESHPHLPSLRKK